MKLDTKILDEVFEMWWPKLEEKITTIIANYKEETHSDDRSDREILYEILDLTRMYTKRSPRRYENIHFAISNLLRNIENLHIRNRIEKGIYNDVLMDLYPAVEVLCAESGCIGLFQEFIARKDENFKIK